jgi:hypothetical protein
MVSLDDEQVRPDEGRGCGGLRADGRERLADGSEHLHNAPEDPVPLVDHGRPARRRELRPDEDRPIIGQILDHAELLHAPT